MRTTSPSSILLWAILAAALVFLYAPLVHPMLVALTEYNPAAEKTELTFKWFEKMVQTPIIVQSAKVSSIAALLVAAITPLVALLGAMAVREFRPKRLIVLLIILPLFVPGVAMGLSTAFFFKLLGIQPSLLTIVAVQSLWALPFAFLIILTSMSSFNTVYLEAAYLSGANRFRAFVDIELPQIKSAISSAAIFSAIISFNETIRTTVVQGPLNTIQTYIWSTFLQVGLSPALFAVMASLIFLTLALVALLIAISVRQTKQVTGPQLKIPAAAQQVEQQA